MKYRTLSDDELIHFESDLKAFLILNGIDGSVWEKINQDQPEKARALVDLFSDQVLQTIYERIEYLEHRSKQSLLVFHINQTNMQLIAIHTENPQIDMSSTLGIHNALLQHIHSLEFFQSEKSFETAREMEIHRLIEQGAIPSTRDFWNQLNDFLNKE